jgi:1-acyl-sn-glycerol-3-phosphate acyltransferase
MVIRFFPFLFIKLFKSKDRGEILEGWGKAFGHFVMKVTRSELIIEEKSNADKIPRDRPVVIISNHESFLDIPCMMAAMDFLIGFIAKIELGRIPVLGYWIQELGGILLDRRNLRKSYAALNAVIKRSKHRALLIFPEGTRNKQDTVAPFKVGSLRLAFDNKAVILPVCICGSRRKLEGNRYRLKAGKIYLRIHAPIDTRDVKTDQKRAFAVQLHALIMNSHQEFNAMFDACKA